MGNRTRRPTSFTNSSHPLSKERAWQRSTSSRPPPRRPSSSLPRSPTSGRAARTSLKQRSNAWANTASHTYALKRQTDGATHVEREGKNLKGRFLGIVLGTVGKGRLESAFGKFVKAVESRNDRPSAA